MKTKAARPIVGARIVTEDAFCATCNDFPRDAVRAGGRGKCAMKATAFAPDSPACPIYQEATDGAERKKLMCRLTETQQKKETHEPETHS